MAPMRPKQVAKNLKAVTLNIVSIINVVYDVKIYMLIMSHNGMATVKLYLYCLSV